MPRGFGPCYPYGSILTDNFGYMRILVVEDEFLVRNVDGRKRRHLGRGSHGGSREHQQGKDAKVFHVFHGSKC